VVLNPRKVTHADAQGKRHGYEKLRLWSRLDTFIRTQETDGVLTVTDPLAAVADVLEMPEALSFAEEIGIPIRERTLRWNLSHGNVPGALKDGGRWRIRRGLFMEWLKGRG
jgi:hypothetical protein